MQMLKMKYVLYAVSFLVLAGCTSSERTSPVLEKGYESGTVQEVYDNHVRGGYQQTQALNQLTPSGRQLTNESNVTTSRNVIRRANNPELVVTVYAHIATKHRIIVPNYEIRFPMYKNVQYSLSEF